MSCTLSRKRLGMHLAKCSIGYPMITNRDSEAPSSMTSALAPEAWSGARPASAVAPVRLLCLPYAGASAQIFRPWCHWLAPRVELLSLELPGRGLLVRQQPVERMAELVGRLADALAPRAGEPLALFGHGMGALIAFELARRLQAAGGPQPLHLFVSAQRAPQLAPLQTALRERLHLAPPRPFAAASPIEPAAGTASDFLLAALHADVRLSEGYEFLPGPELDLPVTVFGGVEDASVTRQELEAWRQVTRGECIVRWLPGPALADPHPRALETLGFVTTRAGPRLPAASRRAGSDTGRSCSES